MGKVIIKSLASIIFVVISCISYAQDISDKTIKPNIILIMADDLGYGELSCYGSTSVKTPNLDMLAEKGVKFLDFHANGPVCSPTRAALMTGRYQQRSGVEGVITAANHREVGLSLDENTLAEELNKLGYTTAMYGKWHLGYAEPYNPTYQGFDQFQGFVSGNVDYHSHVDQEGYLDWWRNKVIDDEKGYTTDLITNHGVDFIKNNNPKKTGRPFFLYLAQEAPHYPIQGRNDKPVRQVGSGKYIRKVPKDSVQSIYAEMIETMDEGIGEIIKTISNEGLEKNTIVIFCSDNGAAGRRGDNGVLRDSKASVYEGGHRVPAIISYPEKIKAGRVSNATIMSMDFYPTLIDFAGGSLSKNKLDGISIKKHLLKGKRTSNRKLYWSFGNKRAMRDGKWKLVTIQSKDKTIVELFDLENDLSEKNDLSDQEQKRVKVMLDKLEGWQNDVRKGVAIISK